MELLITLQEKYIKKKQIEHYTKLISVQSKFRESAAKFVELTENIVAISEKIKEIKSRKETDEFELISLQAELKVKCAEFNGLAFLSDGYKQTISNLEENTPW